MNLDCPSILELHKKFVALYHGGQLNIRVFSFVETALTLMSVLYLRIVGVDSAGKKITNLLLNSVDNLKYFRSWYW